jgi:hypothetical protein
VKVHALLAAVDGEDVPQPRGAVPVPVEERRRDAPHLQELFGGVEVAVLGRVGNPALHVVLGLGAVRALQIVAIAPVDDRVDDRVQLHLHPPIEALAPVPTEDEVRDHLLQRHLVDLVE